jgi:biotin synthase
MDNAVEVERSTICNSGVVRNDWTRIEAEMLYALPFGDLMFKAQSIHRSNFDPNHIETASLLSIKTGGCPEDCGYCSQSAHYDTGLRAIRLMDKADVIATARRAKDAGAARFCMAAAWRSPKDRDLDQVCDMVGAVKGLGMETCVTLGMLTPEQARRLSDAGARFLQSQHRHLAGILRQDHHHPHPAGQHRHTCTCARCRNQGVLRWHCRHG